MTSLELLQLAKLAVVDLDARQVLQDAIEESGWDVRANGIRVHEEMYHPGYAIFPEWDGEHVREWFRMGFTVMGERTKQAFVDAIVTVLEVDVKASLSNGTNGGAR